MINIRKYLLQSLIGLGLGCVRIGGYHITIFPLIQAGSHIQVGSLIQAGGLTAFVPIEAGSLIEAGV